ncbi:MAG: HypC/HybG/HupF family hydrogenase formation chaperone [Actinomycetota bacterium]|nr:HypC/HybG/HupF family hydrogenase formation chaperone [Actinomycetota bacterium]
MCLGVPGRVVNLVDGFEDQLALVDVGGAQRRVNIGMLDVPPGSGAWILVHMGFAVDVLDEDEAHAVLAGLEMMGQPREGQEVHLE